MSEQIARTVTSGTIAIEDGTKAKEEFAPARKVKVELSFAVPEGQDGSAFLNGVVTIAEAKLAELLGRAVKTNTTAAVHTAPAATVQAEASKAETAAAKKKRLAAEEAAKPKGTEKTKADLEREHLESLKASEAANKGGAKIDDELLEEEPTITATGKVVEEVDELADLLGDTPVVPITDKELGDAVQKKNAERKEADPNWAPVKIRDVISKFSGGKRVNDIPAAKRADFLKEIEALK